MGCSDGQETGEVLPSLDLTEALNADQARAGVVTDEGTTKIDKQTKEL